MGRHGEDQFPGKQTLRPPHHLTTQQEKRYIRQRTGETNIYLTYTVTESIKTLQDGLKLFANSFCYASSPEWRGGQSLFLFVRGLAVFRYLAWVMHEERLPTGCPFLVFPGLGDIHNQFFREHLLKALKVSCLLSLVIFCVGK